jgi:hypothetical protein
MQRWKPSDGHSVKNAYVKKKGQTPTINIYKVLNEAVHVVKLNNSFYALILH